MSHYLSHYLPSSSCARQQRYQFSLRVLPLSSPPSVNKSTKTKPNYQDSGAVATQVPLISRTGTLTHDLPFHFCINRQQYQYGCPTPAPFPCRHSWRPLLRGVASCSPPRPCASHLVIKHSAASTTTRYRLPPFLAAVGHDSVSTPNAKGTVFVHASVARNTP